MKFTHLNENNESDIPRLWSILYNCQQVIEEESIEGDLAEVGVFRGNTAYLLAWFAQRNNRTIHLFDTFQGFDERDCVGIDNVHGNSDDFKNTSLNQVEDLLGELLDSCELEEGRFPETLQDGHKNKKYSVVSIDCDLYEPIKASLDNFYPLMSKGGIFLIHDYSSGFWEGATQAVNEFCKKTGQRLVRMPDKSGSAFIRIN